MASRFGPRWDPDTDEVANPEPYDYGGAKRAHARASRDMTAAADLRVQYAERFGDAERAYRMALSKEIVRQHNEEGLAWTVAADVARGVDSVANLRRDRDVAKGMLDAAEQLAWKSSADRRGVEQLVSWSMRVAPDGQTEERR